MAQATLVKTEAEQRLAAEWAEAKTRLAGPANLREAAFRHFETAGLPNRRVEEWKYTDLRALMREAKPLALPPDRATLARAADGGRILSGIEAHRFTIVNGFLAPPAPDAPAADPGIMTSELFAYLADPQLASLNQLGGTLPADDVAVALNTAFMSGGVVIQVARDALTERPVHIAHVFSGAAAAAVYPRSLVVVEPGARLTLIETFDGPAGVDYQVNAALELIVGEGAEVERIRIVGEGSDALHLSSIGLTLGAGAIYNDFTLVTGGAVVRNQAFVRCGGQDARVGLRGVSLLRGKQHADTTLVLDHRVSGCESREVFRSVLDDRSRNVFQGKIIVQPDAQKTDARMVSNALMLSPDAEADNKPELEIFADDVQCGHGATAGALDENLKFYLMARGIPAAEAETLLIQSFVGEVIDAIAHEGMREVLAAAVETWLRARI
ncbi:MAG: Fe-S cluster assembly protein SufD [Xanthobacteraceae bacterium]